jgi:hypothetical protein
MRRSICIGCGCDEDHACMVRERHTHAFSPCFWLRFEAASRTGVCSACEDLVKVWDAAKTHEPILPLIAERFYRQVLFLYEDTASALAWLRAPQLGILGGRSPAELILEGRLDEVQTVLDQLRSGAFV